MTLTLDCFKRACDRIRPYVNRTRLLECPEISRYLKTDSRIFLKLENEQKTNSFKARGAYNALLCLSPEEKQRGVAARSSGNFAQAVALAAHTLQVKAVLVMPVDVPEIKKKLTMQYHPEIKFSGKSHEEGDAIVAKLVEEFHYCQLSPYNQMEVIEGQGTLAMEVFEDLPSIRHFFCPIGGGGLLGGCATALKLLNPDIEIIGIEPSGADDYQQWRTTGRRVALKTVNTIADGLRASEVGELNCPLLDKHVDKAESVSDEEILKAMKFANSRLGMVIEPSGACALASLMYRRHQFAGDAVCVISGANVDPDAYARWMKDIKE